MDTFHNILLEHIDSLLKERLDLSGDADIEKEINNLIPKIAIVVKNLLLARPMQCLENIVLFVMNLLREIFQDGQRLLICSKHL